MAGGTSTCETSRREVGDALGASPGRRPSRWPAPWSRSPTAKKTTCRSGLSPRELHRVERRVDDAHVAAGGLDGEQIAVRARHAQHVAERAEDDVGPRGDLDRLVDHLERRDADRAARAVDQRDLRRQQLVDAELDDRVGLAAADLHERPRPRDRCAGSRPASAAAASASRYSSRYFTARAPRLRRLRPRSASGTRRPSAPPPRPRC